MQQSTLSTLFFLLLPVFWMQEVHCQEEFPIVTVKQGDVKGKKVNSSITAPFYSFQGIPYAKPPVGELRFKAPVDPEPWEGTFEALKEGSVCTQLLPRFDGREDCLFINVYTPQLPGSGPLKPVMVWIHGGAFKSGSGNKLLQGPEYLLNAGVVYVSFNYRLDVFGFLSTEDSAAPGNAGLKDQVQALRWVQNNIAAFGGDPNKVTIFGESAGGASVQFHMISPMSKGLFQGAIAMSGSVINPWAVVRKPKQYAFRLAKDLGISVTSTEELVNALRNEDAVKLLNVSSRQETETKNVRLMNLVFLPAVESNEESFLPAHPLQLLEQGKIHDIPFMTGMTTHEGILLLAKIGIFTNSSATSDIDENMKLIFKNDLRFCYEDSCNKTIFPKIRKFYFEDKAVGQGTSDKFVQFATDMYFAEGIIAAGNFMSSHITSPVYMYQFSYDGGFAFLKKIMGAKDVPGVAHADDLGYIFHIPFLKSQDEMDLKTRSRMVTLWANFAKTGNPTPGSADDFPTWPPYKSTETKYLDIGSLLEVRESLNKDRMEFWQDLYASIKR